MEKLRCARPAKLLVFYHLLLICVIQYTNIRGWIGCIVCRSKMYYTSKIPGGGMRSYAREEVHNGGMRCTADWDEMPSGVGMR